MAGSGFAGPKGVNLATGFIRVGLVFGLALLLGACGGEPALPAGRELLVLGVVGTDEENLPGFAGMVQGVRLAVDQYNRNQDSRYEIELKQLATKVAPGEGGSTSGNIAKTERLIGVIGPFSEQDAAELGPQFEGAGVPFIIPPITANSVPQEGWRSFRRLVANDRQEGGVLAKLAAGRVNGSIVIVAEQSAPGQAFAAGAKEVLDEAGRPPARTESIEAGKVMDTLAASVVEGGAEAILYGGGAQTGAALLDGLRKASFKGVLVASHQLRDAHPQGIGPGVISSSPEANSGDASVTSFVETFRSRFDAPPQPFALEAYEGTFMLLDAIEEVEGKPREITRFLQLNPDFRGDSKLYRFTPEGELTEPPLWIYESQSGSWRFTGRSDRPAGQ
ncbi:MAG: ABC transporter substrate-binding protein [Actinomycetota bacterium]